MLSRFAIGPLEVPGACLGLSVWPALGLSATVLLTSAAVTLPALLGLVRRWRARTARRWRAALEAYADREIARARVEAAARVDRILAWARVAPPTRPRRSPGRSRL